MDFIDDIKTRVDTDFAGMTALNMTKKEYVETGVLAKTIREYVKDLYANKVTELVDYDITKFLSDGLYYDTLVSSLDLETVCPMSVIEFQREINKSLLRFVLNTIMWKVLNEN